MQGRSAALCVALVSWGAVAWGQDAAASHGSDGVCTVRHEDVKSWTTSIDGKDWSVRPAAPTYEGDTGLFRLSSAYTLPKGKVSIGLYRDNYDRDPKGVDASLHGVNFAYGVSHSFEVFGNVGIQNRVKVNDPLQPGFPNDYPFAAAPWETGFGDVRLGVKYAFLNDYRGAGVGLALRGVVKLPTADETQGLGTGKTSFAADLVLSKSINRGADLHASVGYEVNSDPDDVDIANALRWGVGLNIPACRRIQLQLEVTGRSYGDTSPSQTDTADLIVGPALWLGKGFFIRPAWSYAMGYDGRGRDVSFGRRSGRQLEVGYHPGTPCCEVLTPPPPPPPPANRPPTVSLDCVKESVLPGETTPCNASAADPDGDPLTYAWTASAGRITGSGATTTLETAGVRCDTTITVTVTVSDGRGGTASASDTVRVRCPETAKAEAASCTSGGFPRNLARLNNVDKACLDDVATKLRQDPRSRVVIIGHADQGERYPEVIARKRAEAAKGYLAKERGIEEARITARSAAAGKPLERGTTAAARARNRRVEVFVVPEGASAPE
jgi:outer membrane protein OmpA-like peptidoglycan-associated protein